MLAVYDLTCNGLRDACGVSEPMMLSWRLGSDRPGAAQRAYRLVVTSMKDGSCKWDTGSVTSFANKVVYGGDPLGQGETCVWFVSVTDDAGEKADGAPSSFVYDSQVQEPTSVEGPQRLGLLWTSDEELDDRLDARAFAGNLDDAMWQELVGLSWADRAHERVRFAPAVDGAQTSDLAFAQASVLLSRGLVVARWERVALAVKLELLLPPGVAGVVGWGAAEREVTSGRHLFDMNERCDETMEGR